MVDVAHKAVTYRTAIAMARITLSRAAFEQVQSHSVAKGNVLATAQVAGIMAAKQTSNLIPLCHPLPLSSVRVQLVADAHHPAAYLVLACARTAGTTGVEMEALTAASLAALTIYDMTKAVSKASVISDVQLLYKSGGKSGTYRALESESSIWAAVPPEWLEEKKSM